MSEAEGEWADLDLLHESALAAVTAQASAKPASVPKPAVTLPQRRRTSPHKGSKAVTIAHFFGPAGSETSGAGKGLVTRTKEAYVEMEGKTAQVRHMLKSVDGSNDDLICIDGVDKYKFTNADAGNLPVKERSYDHNDEEEQEQESAGAGAGAGAAGRGGAAARRGGGCLGRGRY
jgi:hypothetical protein